MTEDVDSSSGPNDLDWIRVTSTDGFSYIVRRKIANVSGTMRSMLDESSSYAEAVTRTCHINERGVIVEKMLEYMAFKLHYQDVGPKEDIPVQEYMERLPPEIVLELLVAADYQEGKNGMYDADYKLRYWMKCESHSTHVMSNVLVAAVNREGTTGKSLQM